MRLRKLSAMIGEFVAELLNRIGGKLDDMGPGKARFSQILSRCFSKALKGEFGQIPWEIYLMLALLLILIALIVFRKKVVAIYDFFDAKLHGTLFEPNRATNERGSSR